VGSDHGKNIGGTYLLHSQKSYRCSTEVAKRLRALMANWGLVGPRSGMRRSSKPHRGK
jgi:hypothetical protein